MVLIDPLDGVGDVLCAVGSLDTGIDDEESDGRASLERCGFDIGGCGTGFRGDHGDSSRECGERLFA